MKNIISTSLIAILFIFSILFSQEKIANDAKVRDGILIHISSGPENAHKVVMALKMATIMAMDKDVLVYLDIKGIEVVLKDANDITHPTFPSAQESIKLLLEKGINIYACPSCLKAAGKSGADLMTGIQVANKDRFFDFTKGRILTLDY
ncbi:MAG TPA: peroxiredoxin [Bacteroidetes bacterium]|nr:peroxiredoxin [Bacteroidota bacterium]